MDRDHSIIIRGQNMHTVVFCTAVRATGALCLFDSITPGRTPTCTGRAQPAWYSYMYCSTTVRVDLHREYASSTVSRRRIMHAHTHALAVDLKSER